MIDVVGVYTEDPSLLRRINQNDINTNFFAFSMCDVFMGIPLEKPFN